MVRWLTMALLVIPALAATQDLATQGLATQDLADEAPAATADSLAVTAADSALAVSPAAQPEPPPPDFFDTGISSTAAVLMTPVFPGWGQLYTDNGWRSMLAFGAQWYFWSNMLANDRRAVRAREHGQTYAEGTQGRTFYDAQAEEYYERVRDYAWWSGAILLIIALDAYVGAGLYNFDQEPIPVPTRFDEYFDTDVPEPPGSRGAPQLVVFQWGRRF